ncbi:hypothetical protein ABUK73_15790 [Agrobacterium sp. BA1120]|uniref:hypothetical protein n=1 Tax=Agrobacterium sp. BA1120 TaxID=3228927 RepID=UPI00336A027F
MPETSMECLYDFTIPAISKALQINFIGLETFYGERGTMLRPLIQAGLCLAAFSTLIASAVASRAEDSPAPSFDAASAFCDRQTFTLEKIEEVVPWLDYFSGLRSRRSPAPQDNCPSGAIRAVINITSSGSIEMAEALREGFFKSYVARAMEPDLADRRIDQDGTFRYRNDVVLAGFVWFLCPGRGDERVSCVKQIVAGFPDEFLKTSPVFCDFAEFDSAKVEWPSNRQTNPLVCAQSNFPDPTSWLDRA